MNTPRPPWGKPQTTPGDELEMTLRGHARGCYCDGETADYIARAAKDPSHAADALEAAEHHYNAYWPAQSADAKECWPWLKKALLTLDHIHRSLHLNDDKGERNA